MIKIETPGPFTSRTAQLHSESRGENHTARPCVSAYCAVAQHGHPIYERDADGVPRAPVAYVCTGPTSSIIPTAIAPSAFCCPLLFPLPIIQTCDHAQFVKGKGLCQGCQLGTWWARCACPWDRHGLLLYHAIYTQRTAGERINSQAQALGIERPKVRNGQYVKNLNTSIYLVINAKALAKAKPINRGLLQMN